MSLNPTRAEDVVTEARETLVTAIENGLSGMLSTDADDLDPNRPIVVTSYNDDGSEAGIWRLTITATEGEG